MLKITVRYSNEAELQRYLGTVHRYITRCKPPLSQLGKKGSDSDYYRRDIWLEIPINSAKTACITPDVVV